MDRIQMAGDLIFTDADLNQTTPLLFKSKTSINSKSFTEDESGREQQQQQQDTVFYLAYGSNLSAEKFRGDRGIDPISQTNVYVPELRLTFDIAGVPYVEPCWAGSQYRTTDKIDNGDRFYRDDTCVEKKAVPNSCTRSIDRKKVSLLSLESGYNKDRWHKPLIGVVYEVTLEDYAHIIATEGGGAGYDEIVTTCFPFPSKEDYNPNDPTPDTPQTRPFMAHTLITASKSAFMKGSHLIRPKPSYAQPSARYLKLITDGAEELNFPYDYRAYLESIRPYTISTSRQRLGEKYGVHIILPLMRMFMALGKILADDDGIMPDWLGKLYILFFEMHWRLYDAVLINMFGDGERTIEDI